MSRSLHVLYFGMLGEYSRIPLLELLSAKIDVCAVIIPAADRQSAPEVTFNPGAIPNGIIQLPMVASFMSHNIVHIARDHQIPVFEMNRGGDPETLKLLQELQPDIACVACFPQIISPALLSLPRLGFLNLHPSWLPAYRGPAPLFWIRRQGKAETGVTVHFMDETADTGDIAQQTMVELPDGISGEEAERLCASAGAPLLVKTIRQLQSGTCPRQPQGEEGSYFPMPGAADFQIPLSWSARHAFNFIRGTGHWGRPYPVVVDAEEIYLGSAVSFRDDGEQGRPISRAGHQVWIQFDPGVLHATMLAKPRRPVS